MKILIFDTETTGLPNRKEKTLEAQPYIIQFAGIVVDMDNNGNYKELSRINQFIKPPISIPIKASEVHGIYDIDLKNKKSFKEYIKTISYFLNKPDIIVAHNIKFDYEMIKNEFDRIKKQGLLYDFVPKKMICTMEASRYYCNLPGKSKKAKKPKAPKLQELVKKTLGHYFKGAHDAMIDVEWTLRAFSVLVKEGVIKLEENSNLTLF